MDCSLSRTQLLIGKNTHGLLYSICEAIVWVVPILPLKLPSIKCVLLSAIKIKVPYRLELGKHSLIKLGYFYFMLKGKQCALLNQAVLKSQNGSFHSDSATQLYLEGASGFFPHLKKVENSPHPLYFLIMKVSKKC